MKVLVVYYHPEKGSFNHAMLERIRSTLKKEAVRHKITDLCADHFDPVSGRNAYRSVKDPHIFRQQLEEPHAAEHHSFSPQIEQEIRKIEWCDLMIWQFPLWWFSLPAVFKGYVDRVFAMGRAYKSSCFYADGLFKGKQAMLSLTTGGPESMYHAAGENGDMKTILSPITHGILEFTGFRVLEPHIVYAPAHMDADRRREALDRLEERIRSLTGNVALRQKNAPLLRMEP